ncbi:MAG: MFS transporter [Dactylosporangium sp.]|nr:MFS transporter [Dactylosporangium sp.]NNJ62438.1 MFS transporter [Dactylosporangium sp.]
MSNPAVADRPATFREVLANGEFRSVFAASTLSWFGDNAARAAVTAFVLQLTSSNAIAGATFAISYLPWVGIGAVLTALVDRYSYRKVMVVCDLLRIATMAVIALPGMPVPGMIVMLFVTALLNPPFDAARSALLPQLLTGDRYVVGLSLQKTTAQASIILGYITGAVLAGYDARIAVLVNAATFGFSAFAIFHGVRPRPSMATRANRSGIFRETADGFTLVFRSRLLRAIAILMFLTVFFSILPEGLAAGWAAHLTASDSGQGWYQGVIMMSSPMGFVLGGILIGRYTVPSLRLRLIQPFAVITPLMLVPAFFDPTLYVIAGMNAGVGFFIAGLLPATNSLFVQALPNAYRARAFGVMQSGMQIMQGIAVFTGGALADRFPLHLVVGGWAAIGVVVMGFVANTWPSRETIRASIDAARRANALPEQQSLTSSPQANPRPESAPSGRDN